MLRSFFEFGKQGRRLSGRGKIVAVSIADEGIKMKFFVFINVLWISTFAFAKMDCRSSLFEGGPSYSCKTAKGKELCIAIGYHSTVKLNGVYLFHPTDGDSPFEHAIFENPAPFQCKLSGVKACTHQTFENDGKLLTGYRYRAPDVWDARSSQWFLNVDLTQGVGTFEIKAYDVDGSLKNHVVHNLQDCE